MLKIRVPATSANLGPGFDSLGLALNLWNEISFEAADKTSYQVSGEGAERLNRSARNLLTRAFVRLHEVCGTQAPKVRIQAHNNIPLSSGLGSSAAAIVTGLFAANQFLGKPLPEMELLKLGADMEGHPDNVAAALFGGLVVSVITPEGIMARRFEVPEFCVVIVKPRVDWPTRVARAVLPKSISRADAVFNIGHAVLVTDALRLGDLDFLKKVMADRIHEPYRLKHISGGMAAYETASRIGAAALSGAGPSIITFVEPELAEKAQREIVTAFGQYGVMARGIITTPSNGGIEQTAI